MIPQTRKNRHKKILPAFPKVPNLTCPAKISKSKPVITSFVTIHESKQSDHSENCGENKCLSAVKNVKEERMKNKATISIKRTPSRLTGQ